MNAHATDARPPFPQANNLAKVVQAVLEVDRQGPLTAPQLALAIGYGARQGAYYGDAGHFLGFLTSIGRHFHLTELGVAFADADDEGRLAILRRTMREHSILGPVRMTFDPAGPRAERIHEFQNTLARFGYGDYSEDTFARRLTTVERWFEDIEDDQLAGDETLAGRSHVFTARAVNSEAPLPLMDTTRLVQHSVDAVKLERASLVHERLVDALARCADAAGASAVESALIDLLVERSGDRTMFEVKSTEDDNHTSQIRKAVAQLYEYQYLYVSGVCGLAIAISQPLPPQLDWIPAYLLDSRGIQLVVWTGGGFAPAGPGHGISWLTAPQEASAVDNAPRIAEHLTGGPL